MGVLVMYIKYSKLTAGQLIAAILLNALMFVIFYNAYTTVHHIDHHPLEMMNIR